MCGVYFNNNIEVEYNGIYHENELNGLNNNNINKLKVLNENGEEILYKNRLYYFCRFNNNKENKGLLTYILLNPSTANHYTLDQTARNCYNIALNRDYDSFYIINLYTLRSPKREFLYQNLPNDNNDMAIIEKVVKKSKNIVLAWGSDYNYPDKKVEIAVLKRKLEILQYLKKENYSDENIKCLKQLRQIYNFLHPAPQAVNGQGFNINNSALSKVGLDNSIKALLRAIDLKNRNQSDKKFHL